MWQLAISGLLASMVNGADMSLTKSPFQDCDDCPVMVAIPAGSFMMGSTATETRREGVPTHQAEPERPRHKVTIAKPFALSRTEITLAQYAAFVDATGHPPTPCLFYIDKAWREVPGSSWEHPPFPQEDDHPVICVTWHDAMAYADWLSQKTGQIYRLPSEAEWEFAARAGTETARFWGDDPEAACEHANVADHDSMRPQFRCDDPYRYTAPADFGSANAFDLVGMLGNVGEWTADCGLPDYATSPVDGTADTSGDCSTHTGRGGSWWNDAYYIRAARRFHMAGGYNIVGFRVAREVLENYLD